MVDIYNAPIDNLKGVGKVKKNALAHLGIKTLADLIFYFPRDYEDRTKIKNINEIVPNELVTVKGMVIASEVVRPRPRFNIFKLTISDGTNYLLANWFNQASYMKNKFHEGQQVILTGKVKCSFGRWEMSVLDYEILTQKDEVITGIMPVYPSTQGISQKFLRFLIRQALVTYLPYIVEILPKELLEKNKIPEITWCVRNMHFPDNFNSQDKARKSLAYRELFFFQLAILISREKIKSSSGIILDKFDKVAEFLSSLSFSLTKGQEKVWQEIKTDLAANKPMIRLLQGDVGSGKTVIAAISLITCCNSGYQGALMVPTEILARQHYWDLYENLHKCGFNISLLTGSMLECEKKKILADIASGHIDLIIGTHAIIQETVEFENLGLLVIDEQQRFGVNQRMKLQEKGINANVLIMTATPIPRTLALTLYGNLDISSIEDKPLGRGDVFTKYIHEKDRRRLYQFMKKQLDNNRQAFVICPLIEESDNFQVEAAVEMEKQLKKEFCDYTVKLVHGRLSSDERASVMKDFRDGLLQILIGTTVVEVGINVPNANVMVIEGIERFGLSQLHQLRGRVSRSSNDAYCFLLGNLTNENVKYRAKAMCKTNDGFKIAEMDLKLRGPGEFYGTKQHGILEFKVADLINDYEILMASRADAQHIIKSQKCYIEEKIIKNNKFLNIDLTRMMI